MLGKLYKPMTPGGGAFLICVGTAIISSTLAPWPIGGPILIAGFVLGSLGIAVASIAGRKRGLPKPAWHEITLVWIPVAIELAVLAFLFPLLPNDERLRMIAVIALVGAHFLPMVWSLGPLIVWLGLACLSLAAAGLAAPAIPLPALIATDGALKLGFGLAMFAALFRSPPSLSPTR